MVALLLALHARGAVTLPDSLRFTVQAASFLSHCKPHVFQMETRFTE